jgi:2-succinyl-5-enolpyruvyl-6-hydroxy-3-cyclohexene-1-carboxylate synthase
VRLGEPWVSKVVNGFLSRAIAQGAHSMVVDPAGRWPDPEREVAELVRADPTRFAREVARRAAEDDRRPGVGDGRAPWVADWQQAEDRAQAAMDRLLGGPGRDVALTEPSLARHLHDWLPDPSTLVVSSSLPIRDVESFAGPRHRPPRVLSNRGANGIDGVVSTAIGVALAGPGPTVALVGDLAFLHDVSALVGPEGVEVDLTVVVADNRGGGIFSFLDPASRLDPGTFDTLFATPQAPDPASVAAGFGWSVDDVGPDAGTAGLEEALARRVGAGSRSVIRVQLPGRAVNVARHHEVTAAIVDAVDRPDA